MYKNWYFETDIRLVVKCARQKVAVDLTIYIPALTAMGLMRVGTGQ